MEVNSSSSNDSLVLPDLPFGMGRLVIRPGSIIYTSLYITNTIVLLPLLILVLYLGLQRWGQQRSTSAAAAMISHSDSFTYHMVAVELVDYLGCTLTIYAIYMVNVQIFCVGFFLSSLSWYGQTFFHILTCVERYLAVVHPVTYLSLRGGRGVRIRNICVGCVWLVCFTATTLFQFLDLFSLFFDFCLLIFSSTVVAFCSLSVLCVLIRPGPGEQGGDRKRVDQSKRRAFYTMVAILGVLMLRGIVSLVRSFLEVSIDSGDCVMMVCEVWFNIPSSLVLPLLFLHRAGRLARRKNNTK